MIYASGTVYKKKFLKSEISSAREDYCGSSSVQLNECKSAATYVTLLYVCTFARRH